MNTELYKFVEEQYVENFGAISSKLRMQGGQDKRFPPMLDLYFWQPDDKTDLTTIATNGISQMPFVKEDASGKEVTHRGELNFYVAGKLTEEKQNNLAEFIANLSLVPFSNDEPLMYWTSYELNGTVPEFPTCPAIVLHPPFSEEGWAMMDYKDFPIFLFNIVPLTKEEHNILTLNNSTNPENLMKNLEKNKTNIFTGR